MNNEELKKKIEYILAEYNFETDNGWILDTEEMADALIAAGIGDVNKFADTIASKIACHSYYYGDSIVSAVYVIKQGREIKDVKPVNISQFLVDELRRKLKEAEHRAEVAERALREFAVQCGCNKCPFLGRCNISPDAEGDYQGCFNMYLSIAEKELSEERKKL